MANLQDTVPSTVQQAAELMANSVAADDRHGDPTELHLSLGLGIRNGWSLWKKDTPLKRDAAAKYRLAHPDDISGLINAWAIAIVRGIEFDPHAHCQKYHEHWRRVGKRSLDAGG